MTRTPKTAQNATDSAVSPIEDDQATRTSMLRGACSDDEHAWRRLVNGYSRLIYMQARQAGLSDADACDVLQEVLVKVTRNLHRLRRERPGAFRAWLTSITSTTLVDHVRFMNKHAPVVTGGTSHLRKLFDIEAVSELPSQRATRNDPRLFAVIERVRAEISETTWKLYLRVVVDQCSPADVADEFGVSVNQVYLARSRVGKRIRSASANGSQQSS